MPSKSPAQARLFAAAAHDPEFAKKAGIPQSVAKDFNKADAGTGILKKKKPRHESLVGYAKRKKSHAQVMYPDGDKDD